MDVTLFEVHLPEAQFNAPFANRSSEEEGAAGSNASGAGGDGGSRLAPIAFLAVLVGLALLARYLRSSRGEETAGEWEE